MRKQSQPKSHNVPHPSPEEPARNGIYLNLPHEDYLADPALGSSSVKALVKEPARYWYESQFNPAAKAKAQEPWLKVGSAFHCLALEGPDAFKSRYAMAPGPEYLRTVEQISEFVRSRGGKLSRLKAQLTQDALSLDPAVKIYDVAVQAAKDAGMEILSEDEWTNVIRAAQAITSNPYLAGAVSGGQSEVSVFWTEDVDGLPVRCKCRLDYLKPRANVDLKSMRPTGSRAFEAEVMSAIASYRYDLQAEHYMRGRGMFRQFWNDGLVYGPEEYAPDANPAIESWGQACADADEYAFVFVFWANEGAPLTWGGSLSAGNPILEIASRDREMALRNYARCARKFGADEPWMEPQPLREIDISELPVWFGR